MELPIDIIIRVDAKKENDSGEYTFQCKALGELVRCGECKHSRNDGIRTAYTHVPLIVCEKDKSYKPLEFFCASGERKDGIK